MWKFKIPESFKKLQNRRLAGVAETSALLIIVTLADASGFFPVRLAEIQPHPFWVPVILAASIYGRLTGYLIASLAVLAGAALDWPDLTKHEDFYDFLIANSSNAIMWLGAATVLGSFRENHLNKLREVQEAHDHRASEAQILSERCRSLIREVGKLENRIAASGGSAVGKTLDLFERLLKLPPHQTFDGYRQALHHLIGADGIELHVPSRHGWVTAMPNTGADADMPADSATSRICATVAAGDRVYNCIRDSDQDLLSGRASLAAPIRAGNGDLLGVVIVREVDPACLSRAGEVAIAIGNFILGARHFEFGPLACDEASAANVTIQLRHSTPRIAGGSATNAQFRP